MGWGRGERERGEKGRERERERESKKRVVLFFFGSVFQEELRRSWAQVLRKSDKIYSEKSFQSVGKLKQGAAAGRGTRVGGCLSGAGGGAVFKMTAICLSDSREDLSSAASDFSRVSLWHHVCWTTTSRFTVVPELLSESGAIWKLIFSFCCEAFCFWPCTLRPPEKSKHWRLKSAWREEDGRLKELVWGQGGSGGWQMEECCDHTPSLGERGSEPMQARPRWPCLPLCGERGHSAEESATAARESKMLLCQLSTLWKTNKWS